jgi:hypothetical protein
MISSAVAPHWAQVVAVAGFCMPQMGQVTFCWTPNAAPQASQTLAMGLFFLPHSGQVFMDNSAGLKHI